MNGGFAGAGYAGMYVLYIYTLCISASHTTYVVNSSPAGRDATWIEGLLDLGRKFVSSMCDFIKVCH